MYKFFLTEDHDLTIKRQDIGGSNDPVGHGIRTLMRKIPVRSYRIRLKLTLFVSDPELNGDEFTFSGMLTYDIYSPRLHDLSLRSQIPQMNLTVILSNNITIPVSLICHAHYRTFVRICTYVILLSSKLFDLLLYLFKHLLILCKLLAFFIDLCFGCLGCETLVSKHAFGSLYFTDQSVMLL